MLVTLMPINCLRDVFQFLLVSFGLSWLGKVNFYVLVFLALLMHLTCGRIDTIPY